MAILRYPKGLQTFSKIIEGGYVYVDKTKYIKQLLQQGQFVFLSRPRRFGKSLLLSTLDAYFRGKRELFKGLAADDMDLDWTPSPVLRFDFNAEDYSVSHGLTSLLNRLLGEYEEEYGMSHVADTLSGRFSQLIRKVAESSGRKVVILIDEYDKPLLEVKRENDNFEKNLSLMKSFFGNLKTMDEYIRFVFITGVARFTKVSIFSDLNNLDDISMENAYADICGWTEEELLHNFHEGIEDLSAELDERFEITLQEMRSHYDGYKFTPKGSRLYNPYSVLSSLKAKEIEAFWFETGTPTFLAEWVKENGLNPWELNDVMATREDLVSVGFDSMNPVPLMFQTGYLTIDSYNRESKLFTLRLPNREVEVGFFRNLLNLYDARTNQQGGPFDFTKFKNDLSQGDIKDFMKRLQAMLKDLPYDGHRESTYRAIIYLLAMICGSRTIAEHHGYKG